MTRRTLFGAVTTIGIVGAASGAGTVALFSDTESSTSNSVESGTLNLTLDGGDATVTFLSEADIAPGESGQSTLTVANNGSVPGYIDVEVSSLTDYDNGCPSNEQSKDSTCGDPGPGEGELEDYLEVQATFQNGPDLWSGWDLVSSKLASGTVYDLDYQLSGGGSDTFVLDWRLPSDTGRIAQSDSVELDLTFHLDQQSDSGV